MALVCWVLTTAAEGQQLRSVVVPPEAAVVVPPRGQAIMVPPSPAAPVAPLPLASLPPPAPAGMGLTTVAPILLPLAAAALLGAVTPGSSAAASAPATTR
jgi:hypothetical protein